MNIEEICTCGVCLELLVNPVILQCSHNLCFECANQIITLAKLSEEPVTSLVCPYCRTENSLTCASADAIPKNKALEVLIGEYREAKNKDLRTVCSLCVENPAVAEYECMNCEAQCCAVCANKHLEKIRFSGHRVRRIGKAKRVFCVMHLKELDRFCKEDRLLMCAECESNHLEHIVVPRKDAEEIMGIEIEACKVQLRNLLLTLKENQTKVAAMADIVQTTEHKSLTDLDLLCEKSTEAIQTFKSATVYKIRETYTELKMQVLQKQTSLKYTSTQLLHLLKAQSNLELFQSSIPFFSIKPLTSELPLPSIIFTPQQLPTVELSSPHKFLYYMNRGTTEFYAYSLSTKELLIKELPKASPNISRWSSFTTLADGRILVSGGKVERNSGSHRTCILIDPMHSQYTIGTPMLKGHSSHISLRVMNKVYVISGKNEENICDSFCEVFDVFSENWTGIGRINFPRTCAAGCYLNEAIYVLGGFQNAVSNSIEKYSVEMNVWTLLPTVLPEKIWQHGCFALDSKRILVFGGEKDSEEPNKISFIYDTGKEGFGATTSIENIPVYLYFWIQVVRDEGVLMTINKEKTLVKYCIAENRWSVADLVG